MFCANYRPGGSICGTFLVFGILSMVLYKPWRKRIDRRRASLVFGEELEERERSLPGFDEISAGRGDDYIHEEELSSVVRIEVDGGRKR
jgi:hypothetical protein